MRQVQATVRRHARPARAEDADALEELLRRTAARARRRTIYSFLAVAGGAWPQADAARCKAFGETAEGAELIAEWGNKAARNVGLCARRMALILDSMTAEDRSKAADVVRRAAVGAGEGRAARRWLAADGEPRRDHAQRPAHRARRPGRDPAGPARPASRRAAASGRSGARNHRRRRHAGAGRPNGVRATMARLKETMERCPTEGARGESPADASRSTAGRRRPCGTDGARHRARHRRASETARPRSAGAGRPGAARQLDAAGRC